MTLIALALGAVLGMQDPAISPDCLDDDHNNRCDAEVLARSRALLGVAPIEDEASSGAEVYRAFFVDGYGRDEPAVSFERRSGVSPMVVVRGEKGRSVSAPVHVDVWDRIQDQSRFADRTLLSTAAEADRFCLHARVATVEMANSQVDFETAPVRRRTENACSHGLTLAFAFDLAALAVQAIPACKALQLPYRNDVAKLESCLTLEGDLVAAATLMNEKGRVTGFGVQEISEADWSLWVGHANQNARLDWNGEIIQETNSFRPGEPLPQTISDFMTDQSSRLGGVYLEIQTIRALNSGSGWIEGGVIHYRDHKIYRATSRQEWVRANGFDWALKFWTVGPFTLAAD